MYALKLESGKKEPQTKSYLQLRNGEAGLVVKQDSRLTGLLGKVVQKCGGRITAISGEKVCYLEERSYGESYDVQVRVLTPQDKIDVTVDEKGMLSLSVREDDVPKTVMSEEMKIGQIGKIALTGTSYDGQVVLRTQAGLQSLQSGNINWLFTDSKSGPKFTVQLLGSGDKVILEVQQEKVA